MFCGTKSFSREIDDDAADAGKHRQSPRKRWTTKTDGEKKKKKTTTIMKKMTTTTTKKNPYSTRGLEKFYSLVADLDARKQRIKMDEDGLEVMGIWFVCSGPQDWVPVVVKLHNDRKTDDVGKEKEKRTSLSLSDAGGSAAPEEISAEENNNMEIQRKGDGRMFWSVGVVLGLILLCLGMFGRSFAICCVILWWYFVPADAVSRRLVAFGEGERRGEKMIGNAQRSVSFEGKHGRREHGRIIRRGTSYLSGLPS